MCGNAKFISNFVQDILRVIFRNYSLWSIKICVSVHVYATLYTAKIFNSSNFIIWSNCSTMLLKLSKNAKSSQLNTYIRIDGLKFTGELTMLENIFS